jgi:RNA polymerase sigma factor (sigma-70 family)
MKLATTSYEFDLSKMADEALVVLARESPHLGARKEMILRHFPGAARYIAKLARDTGLAWDDTEEAQQNAEFAIEEAIDRYDLGQLARKYGKTFRQYLRQVVWARFRDFVKHLRREKRHYDCSAASFHALANATGHDARGVPATRLTAKIGDPVQTAILNEDRERLQKAISQLSEDARIFWQELCAGKKLGQIARDLQLTDDQANHRKRRMYAQLIALLEIESSDE